MKSSIKFISSILSLILVTSLIFAINFKKEVKQSNLPIKEEVSVKTDDVVLIKKQAVPTRYIRTEAVIVPTIELETTNLIDPTLPLPVMMERAGFKLEETESQLDYNLEPVIN